MVAIFPVICARISRGAVLLSLLAATLALAGCGKKASDTGTPATGSTAAATAAAPGSVDRFNKAGGLLLEALTKPADSFHFSFKGQMNTNHEWPRVAGSKPRVEPVTLEADISPDLVALTTVKDGKPVTSTAKKGDNMDWAMMPMVFLGPMTEANMSMAFASPAAHLAGTETVNGFDAEKYEFNTATAGPTEKTAIEAAKKMLGKMLNAALEYGDIKGTTWVDKATGRMVKFNIDNQVHDKAGNSCAQHVEGEVTAKK
jgi:hypothetical protein